MLLALTLVWIWGEDAGGPVAYDSALHAVASSVLAQAGASPVNQSWFEQFGPLAIPMALMVAFTWALFRRYEKTVDLEREEKLAAQAELRELNKIAREQMMPALTQATAAITEAMRALRKDHE